MIHNMPDWIIEFIWVPISMLFGWQQHELNKIKDELSNKIDREDYVILRENSEETLKLLYETKIEIAEWKGQSANKQQQS